MNTIRLEIKTNTFEKEIKSSIDWKLVIKMILGLCLVISFILYPFSILAIPIVSIIYICYRAIECCRSIGDLDFISEDKGCSVKKIIGELGM